VGDAFVCFDLDTLAGTRLVAAVAEPTGRPESSRPDLVRADSTGVGSAVLKAVGKATEEQSKP
jgi:hypothetical protein